jgi:hypothetical protein
MTKIWYSMLILELGVPVLLNLQDNYNEEIIKIGSRQHEHTSLCDGPVWLTSERGLVNSWFPFIDGVSLPTTSR